MFKRVSTAIIMSTLICTMFTGCISGNKKPSAANNTSVSKSVSTTTSSRTETMVSSETEETINEKDISEMDYEITDASFNYYTNSIGNVEFYGIIEVTNTGYTDIYLKDCVFDIEDDDGHLLQSESFISSCPDIIAPGEKGYFYNNIGATQLDKDIPVDNGLRLVPNYKLEEGRGNIVDYEVSDTSLRKDDYGHAKVTGRITNTTDEDINLIYIQTIFKDSTGRVLLISGTNMTDIPAGSTGSFEVSTMFGNAAVDFDSIADFEVIARKTHYQF